MDTQQKRFDALDARARHSLQRAREESEREGLAYIGTEQLLLGLLAQPGAVASRVLRNFGVQLETARTSLRQLRPTSTEQSPPVGDSAASRELGLTPIGRRTLELAVEESRILGHHYIGTEHLLLGLIALGHGAAIDMLHHLGVDLAAIRSRTLMIARLEPPRSGRLTIGVRPKSEVRDPSSGRTPFNGWPRGAAEVVRAEFSAAPLGAGLADIEPFENGERPDFRVQLQNNVVMCRVDDADMDAIETLIEAGVRANRSDAAGWLIKAGLESKRAVVDSVKSKVLEIRRLREDARALAENADAQD